jgi:hypothetical protein
MQRSLILVFVLAIGLALAPGYAVAQECEGPCPGSNGGSSNNNNSSPKKNGAAKSYILGSTACAAGLLWFSAYMTSQTQNRQLSRGEAWGIVGACYLPLVGGPVFRNYIEQFQP